MNACLSYLSALVYGELLTACSLRGLDPALGCLHGAEDGRWSLPLDLMEPFRPALTEALTLRLFSHRILQQRHFEAHDSGVWLNPEGRRTLILHYEQRLQPGVYVRTRRLPHHAPATTAKCRRPVQTRPGPGRNLCPVPRQLNPNSATDWWDDLLPVRPHAHPPGAEEMLRVIAYDIASPRRLRRVCDICLDHGVRAQKSVFECWLDEDRFEQMWLCLQKVIKTDEDQLLAYTLDAAAARRRRKAGCGAVISEKRQSYVF